MSNTVAAGSTPVVDGAGVRFTVFHETRGPLVYEISARALLSLFDAASAGPEDLLDAYTKGQSKIHEVACTTVGAPGLTVLTEADFPK